MAEHYPLQGLLKSIQADQTSTKPLEATLSHDKHSDICCPIKDSIQNFLRDFENLPYQSQHAFLNQQISHCVLRLRLESKDNSDDAALYLRSALGNDVHQNINSWHDRLQRVGDRVLQGPLHPLLSSFHPLDLAQQAVILLQRDLNVVKAGKYVHYQQPPFPPIETTNEQEQLLFDLGVGLMDVKMIPNTNDISQKEVDHIIEKARHNRLIRVHQVDISKMCSYLFREVVTSLNPEELNKLTTFFGITLKDFPTLASNADCDIADILHLLWIKAHNDQLLHQMQRTTAQTFFYRWIGRLRDAQTREFTAVIFMGLRTIAHFLGGDVIRLPAPVAYSTFCALMNGSASMDKTAVLDVFCASMVEELYHLQEQALVEFITIHMDVTEADLGGFPRSYLKYRLANPPVDHGKTTCDIAQQAYQGLS